MWWGLRAGMPAEARTFGQQSWSLLRACPSQTPTSQGEAALDPGASPRPRNR